MELKSSAFVENAKIPEKCSCDGEGISPELFISGVPQGAKSLALIMDDPDVPDFVRKDRMWDHWVVYNIPPETKRIPENTEPPGVQGRNTGGDLGYQGPCPPDREHRYFFKLYALDCLLNLKEGATKKDVEAAMKGHILEQCQLMGKYIRK